ncbi:MAG: hypothetical protein GC206_06780 [Alphaproteobacteria bacterium]|nr:hypothetical protein [Alphaproteobacteria bacterium]
MDALNTLGDFFNPILNYFQNGFDAVNAWQGIVVAILAVIVMRRWGQLLLVTFVAALVYLLVEHFWPIVTQGAELRLPYVTEPQFWHRLGAVYAGLLIIIAMFFAVKRVILGFRGAPAGEAKK